VFSLTPRDAPSVYCRDLLNPLGAVVIGMEYRGIPIDRDKCEEVRRDFTARQEKTREELLAWSTGAGLAEPLNWASPRQLVNFFHDTLEMEPSPFCKRGEVRDGKRSTDDRALEWLSGQYPEHRAGLTAVRKLRKEERFAKYAETWLKLAVPHPDGTWRLHPSFGLSNDTDDRAGAKTGRFAVKNPALQQVPSRGADAKLLKAIFAAPPGYRVVCADYSQLEIYILAHLCHRLFGTRGLLDRLAPGMPDMHSATAKYVFGEVLGHEAAHRAPLEAFKENLKYLRDLVKAIRYGLNYGKGDVGFGSTLFDEHGDSLGVKRAAQLVGALFKFDPEIPAYQAWVREYIERFQGIPSLLGRWCPLPNATSWKTGLRNRAWRQALNFPMQAGGQEVTGAGMIAIDNDAELRRYKFRLVLQVHDENIGLVPEEHADHATERVKWLMENAVPLDAPLQVSADHAESWGLAK
jgi:DNA polymerase I